MLRGSCLCEAVHFEVEDAFLYAAYCHCSRCRRRSGSAFTAFGGIEIERLRVTAGMQHLLVTQESEVGYVCFCNKCLSPLYAAVRQRKFVHVQLGALSDAPSRRPDHHIFVGSKAPWHDITDDLPQFQALPTN
jgi:hypothetical protein